MLLRIHSNTSRSAIFTLLNDELGNFLNGCVSASRFNQYLFSERLRAAIWDNVPTKEQFKILWDTLKPLEQEARQDIFNEFNKGQFLQHYYEDKGYPLPVIPANVNKAIASLTKHLFGRTSDLAGIKKSCGETLHENFYQYRQTNCNVCCFCGNLSLHRHKWE